MKVLYYYNEFYSLDVDDVKKYVAYHGMYVTEEGLMKLFENDIYIIDDVSELKQYCIEFGYDYNDMLEVVKDE